jgi:hypothetical protein
MKAPPRGRTVSRTGSNNLGKDGVTCARREAERRPRRRHRGRCKPPLTFPRAVAKLVVTLRQRMRPPARQARKAENASHRPDAGRALSKADPSCP